MKSASRSVVPCVVISMKDSIRLALKKHVVLTVAFLCVTLCVGLIRLSLADQSEPEFTSTALGELVEGTVGRIFDTTPVFKRTPVQQLAFWEPKINQIISDHPGDAEMFAAAALIYDAPSYGFKDIAAQEAMKSNHQPWECFMHHRILLGSRPGGAGFINRRMLGGRAVDRYLHMCLCNWMSDSTRRATSVSLAKFVDLLLCQRDCDVGCAAR